MTTHTPSNTPMLLVILDGFGLRAPADDNAISQAKMPCWQEIWQNFPHTELSASEEMVGLPKGQMGNSEVGHMNIGSGRVVLQELPKINKAIADGELFEKEDFKKLLQNKNHRLHIIGLLSDGGVHGHQDQMAFVTKYCQEQNILTLLHFITDGRDTAPQSAKDFWQGFQKITGDRILPATLSGRYFAMDRDKNWQRTEKSFQAIVQGTAKYQADDLADGIGRAYDRNETDEFITPTVIGDYKGMQKGDAVLFMNFRADRARQLSMALVDDDFSHFKRGDDFSPITNMAGLVEYSKDLSKKMGVLFGKEEFPNTLGEVLAKNNLRQLRIAETEKYAHVTFFFNGGREQPYDKEDRILIPSPKVATYDLQPEMSAEEVTQNVLQSLEQKKHDVIILNYANADMVGHSGLMQPAITALEKLDGCLARLKKEIIKQGGMMIVTADHGNIELMFDKKTNQANTAHSLNPVPFVVAAGDETCAGMELSAGGKLADIAPTMLDFLNIDQPLEMTGRSLRVKK